MRGESPPRGTLRLNNYLLKAWEVRSVFMSFTTKSMLETRGKRYEILDLTPQDAPNRHITTKFSLFRKEMYVTFDHSR